MKRRTVKILAVVVVLYVVFPFIAGLFAIGDRDGPKIYPRAYHANLYIISYEIVRKEKPRSNIELERPWFYGLTRHRIQASDRNNVIFVCNLRSERHSSLGPVCNFHASKSPRETFRKLAWTSPDKKTHSD